MNEIDDLKALAKLDLNLIVVLRALDEFRHVTRAAAHLGVSQSAVSHALGRLRQTFGDNLYVKTPNGMVPTPKAEALARQVAPLVGSIGKILLQEEAFSPSTIKRVFRIQTTDLIEALLLPTVTRMGVDEAPGLQVSFSNVGFSLPRVELEQGKIDLAIAGFFGKLPPGFYRQALTEDSFMCCVHKSSPMAKNKKLGLSAYCAASHVLIAPGGNLTGKVDAILAKKKLSRRVVVGTSGFLAAGLAVTQSDMILTAPAKLIEMFARYFPIASFAPPLQLPPIRIVQVWHERQHKDQAHKWMRERIKTCFALDTKKTIPF